MYELIIQYGPLATLAILGLIGMLLLWLLRPLIENMTIWRLLIRLGEEARAAVLEVQQTFVDELKAGKADGKLTTEEKARAKAKAIAIAKSNLGKKGLRRLARVLDVDGWIGNKIEAFIGTEKAKEQRLGKLLAPEPLPPQLNSSTN